MQGSIVFLTALLSTASIAHAGVAEVPRALELGSVSCNVARVKIVAELASTRSAVNQISDATVKSAATDGLNTARSGILDIALALVSGGTPPQSGRDKVEAGLQAAGAALGGGSNSTDTAVGDAQSSLTKAAAAGKDVVANC